MANKKLTKQSAGQMRILCLILLILPALACFQVNEIQANITPTAAITATATTLMLYSPSPTAKSESACLVTALETLNVRALPGTNAAVIAVLKFGDQLTILRDPAQGVWIRVRKLNIEGANIEGWINSNYCKRKN